MSVQHPARLAALALAVLCATARGADEPKVETSNDLPYAKVGDRDLRLDLARPTRGDGPFPAVVVIHGGAWRQGDKADVRSTLADFARHGYVAISPQYRFCPRDIFPAQVHDVKAAVRWLREHADEYKVDPRRLGAIGFSAGGHLALMLGTTGRGDGLEGEGVGDDAPDSKVQAVVNYFGPADLAATDIPDISKGLLKDFLGGTPADRPDLTRQASPVTFVTRDDGPILTFQGTNDPLVPHTQAYRLADAMTRAGIPGRVELLVGASHGWGGREMERTVAETFAFFDRYLKPSRP